MAGKHSSGFDQNAKKSPWQYPLKLSHIRIGLIPWLCTQKQNKNYQYANTYQNIPNPKPKLPLLINTRQETQPGAMREKCPYQVFPPRETFHLQNAIRRSLIKNIHLTTKVKTYRWFALPPCWCTKKRKFVHIVCIKMEVNSQKRKNLLFLYSTPTWPPWRHIQTINSIFKNIAR